MDETRLPCTIAHIARYALDHFVTSTQPSISVRGAESMSKHGKDDKEEDQSDRRPPPPPPPPKANPGVRS